MQALGHETPIATCISVYSEMTIPACHVCFRHSLPFRELVRALGSGIRANTLGIDTGEACCTHCYLRFCRDCSDELNIRIHSLVCHRGDARRRGLLSSLRDLGIRCSESIPMALDLCASLSVRAVQDSVLPDDVFRAMYNRDGYFDSHPCLPYPDNGYGMVSELISPSPMITEPLYNKIIATFDRTNLAVEIESFSMMDDLEHPIDGLDDLRNLYFGSRGFSAIPPVGPEDFPIPVVIGSVHYPTVARLNHSCDPNIDWRSVNGTNEIEVYALCDIRKGDELFISYIDQTLSRPERQEQLRNHYGFTCTCRKCQQLE